MFTNVVNKSTLPNSLRNTLPRVTIKDNPICLDDQLLTNQQQSHHYHHQSSDLIDLDHHNQQSTQHHHLQSNHAINGNNQGTNGLIFNPTGDPTNLLIGQHEAHINNINSFHPSDLVNLSPSSSIIKPYYNWKRLTVYIVLTVILILVIINGATTIWIMAQINFSMDGMGSLSIDSQSIKLNGQAFFLKDLISPRISSPKDKRIRISSKIGTELRIGKDSGDGKIGNKLQLTKSTVVAVSDQLTINNHLGKPLLTLDDEGLKLTPTRIKITGSDEVQLQGSIQTTSVKCSSSLSSSPLPLNLSISSSTRRILIKSINHVNLDANYGNITIESLKDFQLISTNRKINLNSTWIILDNLKTVVASRSGKSYPNILSLCACPNGQLFISSNNNQCIAHDNFCNNHSPINDNQHKSKGSS
ncbi:gamma-sarcoglycan-like [Panonychus citri]|uniref:gamma-sarcoglycan-like n=1 Tax=Panonychus citri TaxID=50023 RepID=UPI002307CD91|nr:gamma-sarcoglycan-like [Panonychus citri]